MKPNVVVFLAVAALTAGEQANHVQRDAAQRDMNSSARNELNASEGELAAVLQSLRQATGASSDSVAALDRAQVAWEAYRDAQLDALWPNPEQGTYGSVLPMCIASARTALTKARIQELRAMLTPVEGDVCGSRGQVE